MTTISPGESVGTRHVSKPILEQGGVDRSVESPCRRQAAKAKAGDQSHRFVKTHPRRPHSRSVNEEAEIT